DAAVLPRVEPIGDPLLRADEAHLVDQLERYRGRGFLLLTRQVQVLDLLGCGLEAVTAGKIVVEGLAAPAPAAALQRELRADETGERLDVVADDDRGRRRDVELAIGAATLRATGVDRRAEHFAVSIRREEDRQPAVTDLGRELHVLRSDRREIDRDV